MLRATFCRAFAVVALTMGCSNNEPFGGEPERPSVPETSTVVTTAAGARLTGRAIRVDIDWPYADSPPRSIDIVVTAKDGAGKAVLVHAAGDPQFLSSGVLSARLRGEPGSLEPGEARILFSDTGWSSASAPATEGSLRVNLVDGQLRGEVIGAGPDFDLHFEGRVLAACYTVIPGANAPVPVDPSLGPVTVMDGEFETPACSPYAFWMRQGDR